MHSRARLMTALLLATAAATGCSSAGTPRALPDYCVTSSGSEFWRLVEGSCREATDGDVDQARALRGALAELDVKQVADFHRSFVRAHRALGTAAVADAANAACAPGLGLGDDLFTDFRSWVVAHGEQVHAAVLDDPTLLEDLPDISAGCGMGEPFGGAALREYAERTGRPPARTGLPLLERPARATPRTG